MDKMIPCFVCTPDALLHSERPGQNRIEDALPSYVKHATVTPRPVR